MKKLILTLSFLILPSFLLSQNLPTILKNIITVSWDYGFVHAKSYDDCIRLAATTLNKVHWDNEKPQVRLFFFNFVNASCRIGFMDRITHQNHLPQIYYQIDQIFKGGK